jgi:hypothetical protein
VNEEQGLTERWLRSPYLPWLRLFGGIAVMLAGVWVVVAGPLYQRMWLVIVGLPMLLLGGYLVWVGWDGLRRATSGPTSTDRPRDRLIR